MCDEIKTASAEPSAPIAWHVGGNGYDRICFEKPDDLPGSPCIQAIHDQTRLIDLLKRYDLRNEEPRIDAMVKAHQGLSELTTPKFYRGDVVHSSKDPGKYWQCMKEGAPGVWEEKNSIERPFLPCAKEPSSPVDRDEVERQFFLAGQELLIGIKNICKQDAPVERDERALIELALSEYGKATGKHALPGGINENQDGFVHGFLVRAALERKP